MNMQTHTSAPVRSDVTGLQWRIKGEYLEMPGLRLSLAQASRLWALEHAECGRVLDSLVSANFLQRDGNGRYIRRGSGY